MREHQFDVEVSDTLEAYAEAEKLLGLDLIVPVWTMGEISKEQVANVSAAVQNAPAWPDAMGACATRSATTWTGSS
ncbi:hypothetical protein HMSSN036_34770 [Paenibacillus macerans]|nr:hypothetical protein HMSSN036_34770 [Paenibacillus macerans]